jgi:hypothetical protein
MGPKNQRSGPRRSESVPTYDDARNCLRNDTQKMDQTSDLPRNQNEAEEVHTERETQSSSSSSSSVMKEPVVPGEHLNRQSASRKINKANNVRLPVFEQNKRILEDDDSDYVDDLKNNNEEHDMTDPHHLPHEEEHVAQELEREFDVPDDIRDDTPGQHESIDNTDQLFQEIDSNANESV